MKFIAFVTLLSSLLMCWHGFRNVNVTIIKVDVRRRMLAEAVPKGHCSVVVLSTLRFVKQHMIGKKHYA